MVGQSVVTDQRRADRDGSAAGGVPIGLGPLLVAVVALVGQATFLLLAGDNAAMETWSTIFVAIVLQALPFLGLGVLLSAALAAFVPDDLLRKALPRNEALAVGVAGVAGAALPGCECASVPVAGRLVERGVKPAAALAFLLSAPAINPVVLVATAVAFPRQPGMVLARFVASLATSVAVGLIWARFGRPGWLRTPRPAHPPETSRWSAFHLTISHDFLSSGGFLVIGAATSATLNVAVPPAWLRLPAGVPVLSVLVMALLAVVLAVCSEADAFVAASFVGFSNVAKLVFMVVGPAVDLKLIALQIGTFGRAFAVRFAPLTLAAAVVAAVVVGLVLV